MGQGFGLMLDDQPEPSECPLMSTSPSLLELPENLEFAVGLTGRELADHVKLMAALKMFELGKISSGKAAELAGMSRVDFFATCSRYRVSIFNYPPEELEAEIAAELGRPLHPEVK
jgi:predicted HTH domain antitoxin